jgi:predicted DNA binding CopG/RHH family protein
MPNRFSESATKGNNTAASQGTEEAAQAALGEGEREESQINVRLPKPLHEAFREKTSKEARQMSALVRKWIQEYVREDDDTHV